MNREDLLFSDYKCLFIIQLFNIILERITLRGLNRLPPFEISDDRLVRSKNQFIQSISLSIFSELDESFLPYRAYSPNLIEFKCGRSIDYSNHSNT